MTLPQASLSWFLGCNWSCPACEPPCQAEISERGKGEEGLDQVLPPAPSALPTTQRGPLAPACLEPSLPPSPSVSCPFSGPRERTPEPPQWSRWAKEAGLHTQQRSAEPVSPPLFPGLAPPRESTPVPDTVVRCMLRTDPASTQSSLLCLCSWDRDPPAPGPASTRVLTLLPSARGVYVPRAAHLPPRSLT